MSDIDDDLLALAEGTSSKRKSSKASSKSKPKRKRPTQEQHDSASDMDMSTDEDAPAPARKVRRGASGRGGGRGGESSGSDADVGNQYPLEGKYRDEADKARIQSMTELEREEVLGERSDLLNAETQRRDLRRMVKAKERAEGGATGGRDSDDDDDEDDGGMRGSRDRKVTGTTKAKRDGIEKLKRRREEKGKKAERKHDDEPSSPRRRHSSRDAYTDDSGSEEGELDTFEAKAEAVLKASKKAGADVAGPSDLKDVTVTRTQLAAFCAAPWFGEWVKGAWVRYLIGQDRGESQYRLCQVESVKEVPAHPYRFENVNTDIQLELRHAKAVKFFTMEGVSNSPTSGREFARLSQTLATDSMALPSLKDVQKLKQNLDKRKEYVMTEADLSAVLAKKGSRVNPAQGKAKLLIQRDFARSTNDSALLAEVSAQLAKLDAPPSPGGLETEADRMKKVNERNRASNREEIKKAEGKAQDERRRQAAALARGDLDVKVDASARVKTMTRLKYDRDTPTTSRPGTPRPGTPTNGLATPPAPVTPKAKPSSFDEMVAARITLDVDLDF